MVENNHSGGINASFDHDGGRSWRHADDERCRDRAATATACTTKRVLLIKEEEVRRRAGKGRWWRRGWSTEERRLVEVVDRRLFEGPSDLRALLPEALNESFTSEDLARAVGISRRLAQKMTYCLRKASVVSLAGKQGRANLYRTDSA